jgi:urease accessory protein
MQKNNIGQRGAILGVGTLLFTATQALSHHPMGGAAPATFMQGLLSGLGHPVIGFDHLAFILAVGFVTATTKLPLAVPLSFVAASALGVLVCTAGWALPFVESLVALSVLLAGVLLLWGGTMGGVTVALPLALFGLFHGYAFGEAVLGAEATPVIAYLAGLAIIQSLMIYGLVFTLRAAGVLAGSVASRLAGAGASLAGAALLIGI